MPRDAQPIPSSSSVTASTPRDTLWPLAVAAVIAAGLLLALGVLASRVFAEPRVPVIDLWFSQRLYALRDPLVTRAFYGMTVLANIGVVVALTVTATVVLLVRRRIAEAVLVVATVSIGQLLGTLLKSAAARPRPPIEFMLVDLPGRHSFPSGHALAALLLYGVLAFLLVRAEHHGWQRILTVIVAALLVIGVGVSRVYLGVHWPSDVPASWLLGGAWLSLCLGAYLSWKRSRGLDADANVRVARFRQRGEA